MNLLNRRTFVKQTPAAASSVLAELRKTTETYQKDRSELSKHYL